MTFSPCPSCSLQCEDTFTCAGRPRKDSPWIVVHAIKCAELLLGKSAHLLGGTSKSLPATRQGFDIWSESCCDPLTLLSRGTFEGWIKPPRAGYIKQVFSRLIQNATQKRANRL